MVNVQSVNLCILIVLIVCCWISDLVQGNALTRAVYVRNFEMVKYLVSQGADVTIEVEWVWIQLLCSETIVYQ